MALRLKAQAEREDAAAASASGTASQVAATKYGIQATAARMAAGAVGMLSKAMAFLTGPVGMALSLGIMGASALWSAYSQSVEEAKQKHQEMYEESKNLADQLSSDKEK